PRVLRHRSRESAGADRRGWEKDTQHSPHRRRGDRSMNRIALEETTLTIPDLAKLAQQGTVILTHNGKPLAAVKLLGGSDWESLSLANNPQFLALIEESRRS